MSSQKKDLYHEGLGFLTVVDLARIQVSTSMEGHMLQVAGTMLATMDQCISGKHWKVHTQLPRCVMLSICCVCNHDKQLTGAVLPHY